MLSFTHRYLIRLVIAILILSSCSSEKFLGENDQLLTSVKLSSDSRDVDASAYNLYVRQQPNSKWFNLLKVPLGLYCVSGTDTTKASNRFWQRIGEPPVIYSPQQTVNSQNAIALALKDKGYLGATVSTTVSPKANPRKVKVHYAIHPGTPYRVSSITYSADHPAIDSLILLSISESHLKPGMLCDASLLDKERTRITNMLHNHGYYHALKASIRYEIDTLAGPNNVAIHLYHQTDNGQSSIINPQTTIYHLRNINTISTDSIPLPFRPSLLQSKTHLHSGNLYRETDVARTYMSLSSLEAINYVSIQTQETDSALLDCIINILPRKTNTLGIELEGTNTAGNLGMAANLAYTNRNLFRGAEVWTTRLKTAYEAITGLEGYTNQNYIEVALETKLTFPRLIIPFHHTNGKRKMSNGQWVTVSAQSASTSLSLQFDTQERPEFHRRVLTALWNYQWVSGAGTVRNRLDIPSLNYVYMPWISQTFRQEYLESTSYRSALIRYAYENLLILNSTYSHTWAPPKSNRSGVSTRLQWSIESAGNLLYALARPMSFHKDKDNQYTLFDVAFAQYLKFDIDYARSLPLNSRNSIALHGAFGIAQPYGNSTIVPFEKRYFGGGANGVRGWSVRELGPGNYIGEDGKVDFINQTGNLKLLASVELRTQLFWKLNGALYVDAGNIWTTRCYDATGSGGQFHWDKFWHQIAASYGWGLRFNLDYFILRFDMAMKAVNPAYPTSSHGYLPLLHPKFSRDFTFHFAVGLPF